MLGTQGWSLRGRTTQLFFATSCLVAANAWGQAAEAPPTELSVDVVAGQQPVQLGAPADRTEVKREDIQQLPLGDQVSLPRLLSETIPGAVSGAQDRIFFRQNEFGMRFEIDGILLPDQPSNALAEPFSSRNIERLDAIPGALGAEYGERMQSVVKIQTRGDTETKPGADVELAYGSYRSASAEAAAWGGQQEGFHYFLSADYWLTDRGLGTPQPASDTDQTQGGTDPIHDKAHGNNEFLKLDWHPQNSDQLTLLVSNLMAFYQIPNYPTSFLPTDSLFTQNDSYGNDPVNYVPSNTNDTQSETSDFVEAVWRRTLPGGGKFQLGIYSTYYLVDVGNDPVNDLAAITLVPNSNPSSFAEDRHVNGVGTQADLTTNLAPWNQAKVGFKLSASRASGSLSVIAPDTDTPGSLITATDSNAETGVFSGAYVQDEMTFFSALKLDAGIRFDQVQYRYADSAPYYHQFEPRLGVSYLVTDGTKVHAYYGRLFMPPPVEDLHDVFNNLQAGTLGSYDIKPEKSNYYEAGVDQTLGSTKQILKFAAYYKDSTDLLDDAQLLNTSLSQRFNWAHGYAYGIEASVHGRLCDNLSEFVNYGYGIAKGEGLDGGLFVFTPSNVPAPGVYQLLDHVQKHTLTSGLTYSMDSAWASVEGLFGSGLPTGPSNSIGLPSHLTFNLSAGYRFTGPAWYSGFRIVGDILNVADNVYPISIANGFNGSYYAQGTEFIIHVAREI